MLAEIAPAYINHVFFTGSGSESNDTVVRMVRRYWDLLGEPQKSVIISRKNAYHGSTMAGASLGGMKFMHEQGGLPLPGIVHIDQPYWFDEGGDLEPDEFGRRVAGQLEEKILELGLDRVAAFIAEPIQGAGGVIIAPESYWPELASAFGQGWSDWVYQSYAGVAVVETIASYVPYFPFVPFMPLLLVLLGVLLQVHGHRQGDRL